MSIIDCVNKLCEMAEFFAAHGDEALAAECRETANMILDAVAYASQRRHNNTNTKGKPTWAKTQ